MPKYPVIAEFYDVELGHNRQVGEEVTAGGERAERLRSAGVISLPPVAETPEVRPLAAEPQKEPVEVQEPTVEPATPRPTKTPAKSNRR